MNGVREETLTLAIGGMSRRYLRVIPSPDVADGSMLVMLHGTAQRGSLARRITRWDEVAGRAGACLVFPDAVAGYWRDGLRAGDVVDDVEFLRKLIMHQLESLPIDPRRVFLVGVSNGGFMVQRLICAEPALFRGAASVIANMGVSQWADCVGDEPPHLCLIAGSVDPIVPYAGGAMSLRQVGDLASEVVQLRSFSDTVGYWARRGNLDAYSRHVTDLESSLRLVTTDFGGVRSGRRLRAFEVEGGGHHWYGYPIDPAYYATFGPTAQCFNATQAIWSFFSEILETDA